MRTRAEEPVTMCGCRVFFVVVVVSISLDINQSNDKNVRIVLLMYMYLGNATHTPQSASAHTHYSLHEQTRQDNAKKGTVASATCHFKQFSHKKIVPLCFHCVCLCVFFMLLFSVLFALSF